MARSRSADGRGLRRRSGAELRGPGRGLQRRNALDPAGRWERVFEGCESGATDWQRVLVDAETPAGSSILVAARTSDDLAALAALGWADVGTLPDDGEDLDLAAALVRAGQDAGRFLGLRVTLRSDDHVTSPVLRGVRVLWACPGSVE